MVALSRLHSVSITKTELYSALERYLKESNITPSAGFTVTLKLDNSGLQSAMTSAEAVVVSWVPSS